MERNYIDKLGTILKNEKYPLHKGMQNSHKYLSVC